ncbi:uncharacterized protein ACRADG_008052 [Cochliomyia hominivorax]
MFKFTVICVLALALCVAADPIRQRPLRRRAFARQEALPTPAPTGYPEAGVTPEIPFDLPTEAKQPEFVNQQSDEVFDTPETEAQQPDEVYGPPETDLAHQPDAVYGPPETESDAQTEQPLETEAEPEDVEEIDAEEVELAEELDEIDDEVAVDDNGAVLSVSNTFEQPARLVFQRFPQRRQLPVPARLTRAKFVKPAKFPYTARFQTIRKH